MKFSKFVYVLLALIILSCGNDDDGNPFAIPLGGNVNPSSSIDVEAILALPLGSDITDLVTFGNDPSVSAANYTSEVNLFDTFVLDSPQGLAPGDEFLYYFIEFFDEFDEPVNVGDVDLVVAGYLEAVLPDGVTGTTATEYYDQEFWPSIAFRVINAEESEDVNWKYNIECYIRRDGSEIGPYIIDPKLRIKGRTSSLN